MVVKLEVESLKQNIPTILLDDKIENEMPVFM